MRSWDFFDTLLGRACGAPYRVFELIGGEEFSRLRQQAEQKSDKTFDDIYRALRQMTGWSSHRINELQNQEWQWEQRLAFPILENVSGVAANDLVVTDTYFNAAEIRQLADCIGLPPVEIVATYGGKHHGTVWKELRRKTRKIRAHTGDNRFADYEQARRYGFPAVIYRGGEATGFDKMLHAAGHWDVVGISRCVRLQNPYYRPDPRWNVWNKQAQFNLPFLMLCAARLHQYVTEHGYRHLWFLSRDTCLLQRVYNALYPSIDTATFYASRQTYEDPSPAFRAYAQAAAQTPKCLFVDLQGTGKSVNTFAAATGVTLPYIYCAMPTQLKPFRPALYPLTYVGTELEVFNYDVMGRVVDVYRGQPVCAPIEYDVQLAAVGHEVTACAVKYLFQPPMTPEESTMRFVFAQMRRYAPRELVKQHQAHHPPFFPRTKT